MDEFLSKLSLDPVDPARLKQLSPIKWAYFGDAVYEMYIRRYVLETDNRRIHDINQVAVKFVRASAQAHAVIQLQPELDPQEWEIVKRGRNQKSGSVPRNASISDYRYATGFEALLGYLWLTGRKQRLEKIVSRAIRLIEENAEK